MVSDTGGRGGPYINSAIASAGSGRGWGGGHTHHKRLCRARGLFLTLELGTAGPGWPFPISGIPNGRDGRAVPHTGNGETDHRDTNAMYRVLQPRTGNLLPPRPESGFILFPQLRNIPHGAPGEAGDVPAAEHVWPLQINANTFLERSHLATVGASNMLGEPISTGPRHKLFLLGQQQAIGSVLQGRKHKKSGAGSPQGHDPLRGRIPSGAGSSQGKEALMNRIPSGTGSPQGKNLLRNRIPSGAGTPQEQDSLRNRIPSETGFLKEQDPLRNRIPSEAGTP